MTLNFLEKEYTDDVGPSFNVVNFLSSAKGVLEVSKATDELEVVVAFNLEGELINCFLIVEGFAGREVFTLETGVGPAIVKPFALSPSFDVAFEVVPILTCLLEVLVVVMFGLCGLGEVRSLTMV